MPPSDRLRVAVDHAEPVLLTRSDPFAPSAPGAWSPAETLGHLLDSATNNYARIVRAAAGGGLVFDRYDQDEWVRAGRYSEADWPDLVAL